MNDAWERAMDSMREDEAMRAGAGTEIERLRIEYDLGPSEELPFDATGTKGRDE